MPTRTFTLSASALLLTFALSACGANAVPASTNVALPSPLPINVPASPVALADASAAPATADGLLSEQEAHRFGDLPAFTGPAADKFGADNVMAAYKEMVVMAEDYGFTANLMTSHAYRP